LNTSTKEEYAHFWRCNAGQLRLLAQARLSGESVSERLLELAGEYDRLADSLALELPGPAGRSSLKELCSRTGRTVNFRNSQPVKRRN
jgi:hypothetical protein